MKVYGDAVYGTRICAPYRKGDFAFTQKELEKKVFAFYLYHTGDARKPEHMIIPRIAKEVFRIEAMATGLEIVFQKTDEGYLLENNEPFDNCCGVPIADVYILYYA